MTFMNGNKKGKPWFYPETKPVKENRKASETRRGGYPCPCCGYLTLPVPTKEAVACICPVCFWENDVFLSSEGEPSDENHSMTLVEGRENFRRLGACCERALPFVRRPFPEEVPEER